MLIKFRTFTVFIGGVAFGLFLNSYLVSKHQFDKSDSDMLSFIFAVLWAFSSIFCDKLLKNQKSKNDD